jgi:uridine kinase
MPVLSVFSNPVKGYLLENRLIKLFDNELTATNGILKDYNSEIISQIAKFMTGEIKRPVAIGIAGETASGKSTACLDFIEELAIFSTKYKLGNLVTRVNIDDYYYDRSDMVLAAGSFEKFVKNYDLDIPEAFELELLKKHIEMLILGKEVWLPKYDMSGTAKRYDNHTLAESGSIIITEGLYTLTDKVKDIFDLKIFVDVPVELQKLRWYKRAEERGLGSAADGIYNNAMKKADIFIKPSKDEADIVLNGASSRQRFKFFINKILSIAEELHFERTLI